jgi:hypothetical protein
MKRTIDIVIMLAALFGVIVGLCIWPQSVGEIFI